MNFLVPACHKNCSVADLSRLSLLWRHQTFYSQNPGSACLSSMPSMFRALSRNKCETRKSNNNDNRYEWQSERFFMFIDSEKSDGSDENRNENVPPKKKPRKTFRCSLFALFFLLLRLSVCQRQPLRKFLGSTWRSFFRSSGRLTPKDVQKKLSEIN